MQINDLGLAVALYTAGFELSSIDSSDPKRATFCFDKESQQLKQSVAEYFAGELKLDAKKVYENIIVLKKRIVKENRGDGDNGSYSNTYHKDNWETSYPKRKTNYRSFRSKF